MSVIGENDQEEVNWQRLAVALIIRENETYDNYMEIFDIDIYLAKVKNLLQFSGRPTTRLFSEELSHNQVSYILNTNSFLGHRAAGLSQ